MPMRPAICRRVSFQGPVSSPVEPIAMELGVWQGVAGGVTQASGSYSAKWREVGGAWVIEAEICSSVFYDPKGERQNVD